MLERKFTTINTNQSQKSTFDVTVAVFGAMAEGSFDRGYSFFLELRRFCQSKRKSNTCSFVPLHTYRFVSTDLKPVGNIPLVLYREQMELAHVPTPAKNRSAVENFHCVSPTSAATGVGGS
ncbi:hypothetical protein AVEN_109820-1 [Araneus ventricosus]|uniref:Uncharacterized protein n=1 Tax=Araneus ventricosus TaxID=182803 RepID=A0A4Y2GDU6_ARAVE|nr:hypothetical protein AVEN_109820-1 [Araneus ventricosus]